MRKDRVKMFMMETPNVHAHRARAMMAFAKRRADRAPPLNNRWLGCIQIRRRCDFRPRCPTTDSLLG